MSQQVKSVESSSLIHQPEGTFCDQLFHRGDSLTSKSFIMPTKQLGILPLILSP